MTRLVSPQLRWLVATMMMVALPLCCCNNQFLSQILSRIIVSQSAVHESDHHTQDTQMQVAGHHQSTQGSCSTDSDENSPCDDQSTCGCDQYAQLKSLPGAPPTVFAPTTPITILPTFSLKLVDNSQQFELAQAENQAVLRPEMSLLRLRCALII